MKVFFIKSLRGKASPGDMQDVPDGYAINFLLAKGYAVTATSDVIEKYNQEKDRKQQQEQGIYDQVRTVFQQLDGQSIPVSVSGKDLKGNLYKSIRIEEIIAAIRSHHGIIVQKEWFSQYKPIKQTGKHTIRLVYKDIHATIHVIIQ